MLFLPEKIIREGKNGFTSATIWGKRGIGKSTYALKVAYQLFKYHGYSDDEAWDKALDCFVFILKDVISMLEKRKENRIPIIVWDDAGVHAGSMMYHHDPKQARLLKQLMDVVRTSTYCLILTCPSPKGLMKFLREYGDLNIKISKDHRWQRNAVIYQQYLTPWNRQWWKKLCTESFSCYIPDNHYQKYAAKREKYFTEIMKEVEDKDGKGQ